jgi:hypothetical protein
LEVKHPLPPVAKLACGLNRRKSGRKIDRRDDRAGLVALNDQAARVGKEGLHDGSDKVGSCAFRRHAKADLAVKAGSSFDSLGFVEG